MTNERTVLAHGFYTKARQAMDAGHDPDEIAVALFTAAMLFGSEIGGLERMAGFLGDSVNDMRAAGATATAH